MRDDVDYAYLGNGIGVTKTHRGHRIFVYTRDLGLTPHIIANGIWEWAIEHAILKLVAPGDTVVEVGCNMGYHSLAICGRLGPKGRFFGFEANPELFKLLRWSIDHNGFAPRATLYNHAVTQEPGEVEFTFDPEAVGGGHVANGDNAGQYLSIPGFPLDQTLPTLENVALLRMDVEGFEPFVIRGARQILKRSPDLRIVVEWSVEMMGSRIDLTAFVAEMREAGFQAWSIDGNSNFLPVALDDLIGLPHCEVAFSRSDLARHNRPPRTGLMARLRDMARPGFSA
jgi:FkbM family methyltransferase